MPQEKKGKQRKKMRSLLHPNDLCQIQDLACIWPTTRSMPGRVIIADLRTRGEGRGMGWEGECVIC